MFLYDFATKTAQKPDTVATYIRRNEKIFKNHVERREKQLWLDEKAVKILLKKYPEVQRKKYPWWKNETEFQEAMVSAIKGLWDNQEILRKELDRILTTIEELQDAMNHTEPQKENRCILCPFGSYFSPFWHYFLLLLNFSSMVNLILVTFLPVLIGSNSMFISVNSLISVCAFSKTFTRKSL